MITHILGSAEANGRSARNGNLQGGIAVLDNVADGEGFTAALLVRSAWVAATYVRTKKTLVYGQCTSDSPPRRDHRREKWQGGCACRAGSRRGYNSPLKDQEDARMSDQ